MTKRRFFLDGKPDMHVDHFVVLGEGKLVDLAPKAPVEEGAEIQLELVEVDRHDGGSAVGKVEGFDVCVAEAASLVGKRVKVRVERVLDGVAYATLVRRLKTVPEPLTAEAEAEKPTRKPPARKDADSQAGTVETDDDDIADDDDVEDDEVEETGDDDSDVEVEDGDEDDAQAAEPAIAAASVDGAPVTPAKKKTRRGSRGGKNRKKPAGTTAAKPADAPDGEAVEAEPEMPAPRLPRAETAEKKVTIHLPSDDLGREDELDDEGGATVETPSENGAAGVAKKKTRRGSRGGKNRRKRTAAAAGSTGSNGAEPVAAGIEPAVEAPPVETVPPEPVAAEEPSTNGAPEEDWGYVPMSEWVDELDK
jgi:predicted RNA-binding protein with TRAM domain